MLNTFAIIQEVLLSGIAAFATYVLLFPLRSVFRSVGENWHKAMDVLNSVHQELITQRTNCLTTLQTEGEKQTIVLEKISNTLDTIRVEQAKTLGVIEGRSH